MELVVKNDKNSTAGHRSVPKKSSRSNAVVVDSAELRAGPTLGQGLYLVIEGPTPANGGQVKMVPDLAKNDPEYRKIEVISEDRNAANDDAPITTERYEKSMPLSGLSGSRGIELVAANASRKFELMG